MTDGQIKYQTLLENQRHNREVERINAREVRVKETKLPYETAIMEQQPRVEASKWILSGFQGAKLFTDAVKNMIGVAGSVASLFA